MRPILSPPRAQQDGLLVERQLQLRLALDVLNPEALCPLIRSSEARSVRAPWKAWIWTSRTGMGSGSIPRSVFGQAHPLRASLPFLFGIRFILSQDEFPRFTVR